MPGFVIDPDQVDTQLLCPHCHLILRVPYQSLCGHRYCYSCIEQMRRPDKSFICVLDDVVNKEREVFPDRFVQRQLNDMNVKCKNAKKGCLWSGKLKEYDIHLDSCSYETSSCPNAAKGCQETVLKENLEKHLKECQYRDVKCDFCQEKMLYASLKNHLATECPNSKVKCPSCKKDVVRSKLETHKSHECEEATFKCPFTAIGCAATRPMKKAERKKHLENAVQVHLTYLLQFLIQLKDQVPRKDSRGQECVEEDTGIWEKLNELQNAFEERISSLRDELAPSTCSKMENLSLGGESVCREVSESIVLPPQFGNKGSPERQAGRREGEYSGAAIGGVGSLVGSGTLGIAAGAAVGAAVGAAGYASPPSTTEELLEAFRNQERLIKDLLDRGLDLEKKIQEQQKSIDALRELNASLRQTLGSYENNMAIKDLNMVELTERVGMLEAVSYNGQIIMAIPEFTLKRQNAILGRTTSIYSEPFYTSRHGYRMRVRVYLNGDGMGKGTHISLYIVLEKGQYDALLPWPFDQRVTFTIIDHDNKNHVSDTFRPDPTSSSFQRPRRERNIASGCPMFMPLSYLDNLRVVRDDVMFIRALVDTSGLQNF